MICQFQPGAAYKSVAYRKKRVSVFVNGGNMLGSLLIIASHWVVKKC